MRGKNKNTKEEGNCTDAGTFNNFDSVFVVMVKGILEKKVFIIKRIHDFFFFLSFLQYALLSLFYYSYEISIPFSLIKSSTGTFCVSDYEPCLISSELTCVLCKPILVRFTCKSNSCQVPSKSYRTLHGIHSRFVVFSF